MGKKFSYPLAWWA